MKKVLVICALLSCVILSHEGKKKKKGSEVKQSKKMELKTELDSLSYALGISIGNNLKGQGVDSINADAMGQALKDVFVGSDTLMNFDQANEFLNGYFSKMVAAKAGAAKEEGEKFLKENSTKAGVVTLPSGLQYKVMSMGTGAKPTLEDKVTTHYHGMLINGKVFDSSVERGQPATFPLGGVIKGWQEGLQLMPVGSKFTFYIPYDLAYGDRGAGNDIPPYAALVFEVELISIEGK